MNTPPLQPGNQIEDKEANAENACDDERHDGRICPLAPSLNVFVGPLDGSGTLFPPLTQFIAPLTHFFLAK
jgi:hypothetical protein